MARAVWTTLAAAVAFGLLVAGPVAARPRLDSWAMLYPTSERKTYDRVVEATACTYTPGAGRTGFCN